MGGRILHPSWRGPFRGPRDKYLSRYRARETNTRLNHPVVIVLPAFRRVGLNSWLPARICCLATITLSLGHELPRQWTLLPIRRSTLYGSCGASPPSQVCSSGPLGNFTFASDVRET